MCIKIAHISHTAVAIGTKINKLTVLTVAKILQKEKFKTVYVCGSNAERKNWTKLCIHISKFAFLIDTKMNRSETFT
jgi:hypothetical protein